VNPAKIDMAVSGVVITRQEIEIFTSIVFYMLRSSWLLAFQEGLCFMELHAAGRLQC
jgi:hypothetical protein